MNTNRVLTSVKHGLFLLAELPIGILYFTIAVTGLSLAAGLLPLFLLGIPIFIAVMGFAGIVMKYDYGRFHALVGEMPEPLHERETAEQPSGLLKRAAFVLTNPDYWKAILLMLLKLPLGIVAFTIATIFFAVCLSLLAYPIVYYVLLETINVDIYEGNILFYLTDLGPIESSIIYFLLGIAACYGTVKLLPKVSEAYIHMYMRLLKL